MKNKKLILLLGFFCLIMACNFPIEKAFDYGYEIPFPTGQATPASTIELTNPTTALGETESYLISIRTPLVLQEGLYLYHAQSGDTLTAISRRFNVKPESIQSSTPIPSTGIIPTGQLLSIPDMLGVTNNLPLLLPDSELVFSPGIESFDVKSFIDQQGGYLSVFSQYIDGKWLTGAEIIERVARNTSISPKLLLAVVEFRSGWVSSIPETIDSVSPLGFYYSDYQGLFLECSLAAKWMNMGYYGWRNGEYTQLHFFNGSSIRIAPQTNPGTAALQYFLAQIYPQGSWEAALYGPSSLLSVFQKFFSDPWITAEDQEPMFSTNVSEPQLELPFTPGEEWALTGGLHVDWNSGTPSGALDFAPVTGEPRCSVSRAWVLASAAGVVTRSSDNIVVISLTDTNGGQTGWQLFYMHIADVDRIPVGTYVSQNAPIGHPSCEGGLATGTHVHMARKYKGEWIGAGEPFQLVLSGWMALPGEKQFQSKLVKDGKEVISSQNGGIESRIIR